MSATERQRLAVGHVDAIASGIVADARRARFERSSRDSQARVPERKPATPPPAKTPPAPRRLPGRPSPKPQAPAVPDGAVVVSREEWGAISRMIDVVTDAYAKGEKR